MDRGEQREDTKQVAVENGKHELNGPTGPIHESNKKQQFIPPTRIKPARNSLPHDMLLRAEHARKQIVVFVAFLETVAPREVELATGLDGRDSQPKTEFHDMIETDFNMILPSPERAQRANDRSAH